MELSEIVLLGDAFSVQEGLLIGSASVDRVPPTQPESQEIQREKILTN